MRHERDDDYESRFLTRAQLRELDVYRSDLEGRIYAPNSIFHGEKICSRDRLPFSDETLLKIEIARLHDFIDFLFTDKEYCDHALRSEAWDEFEQWEYAMHLLNSTPNLEGSDTTKGASSNADSNIKK